MPRFPLVNFEFESLLNYYPPSARTLSLLRPSASLSRAAAQHRDAELLDQVQRLHELSTFLNVRPPGEDELPTEAAYPDRVYSVEHNLLTALANAAERKDEIFDVLQNAALLFIYSNLRQTPVGGNIRKSILGRLTSCLERVELLALVEEYPSEMLWVFLLGALGAQDISSEQIWYSQKAGEVSIARGLASWYGVVEFLRCMPALETTCMMKSKRLWERSRF
jgi:hypothetical protein